MKKVLFLIVFILFSLNVFAWENSLKPQGNSVSLDLNNISIVISVNATNKEKEASIDLQKYLNEIYNINIPIIIDNDYNGNNFISVGKTNLIKKYKIQVPKLINDGYALIYKDNNLFLYGDNNQGISSAVFSILEEDLGCRFWTKYGERDIPKINNTILEFVPRVYNPPFLEKAPTTAELNDPIYIKENRFHSYNTQGFVHTSFNYVPASLFEEHPEYFSMVDGERKPEQLCWSNPDVIKLVTKKLRENIENYHAESYNISPMDGYPLCDCPECNKLDKKEGTKSATLIKALNNILINIQKDYPNTRIVTIAYLDYVTPPKTIKPHKDLTVMVCSDSCDWTYPLSTYDQTSKFRNDLLAWKKAGSNTLTWNYVCNYDHFLIPNPNDLVISKNIKLLRDYKTDGVFLQGGCYNKAICASGYMKTWVWGKLLWNPDLDCKELMKDFIYGYYKDSAEPIYEYEMNLLSLYENASKIPYILEGENKTKEHPLIFERGTRWTPDEEIYTDDFINNSMKLMDEALNLAKDSELIKRVKYERVGPIYLYLGRNVGYFKGGDNFVRKNFDPSKKEYYKSLVKELEETLKELEVPTVAETFPTDNTYKYISKWYDVLDSDSTKVTKFNVEKSNWLIYFDKENNGKDYFNDIDTKDWKTIEIEKTWDEQGFDKFIGNAWYKKKINITKDMLDFKILYLCLLSVDEESTVYVNGNLIIEHTCSKWNVTPEQIYIKPVLVNIKDYLHEGINDITIKVGNSTGAGGIYKPIDLLGTKIDMPGEEIMKCVY